MRDGGTLAHGCYASRAMTDDLEHRYTAELANALEERWQRRWDETQIYRQPNPGDADFDGSKPKFYCLDMFPYPSGAGLHVGHPEGYTATDILSRHKRMQGFNVLHPMGWDAFGLPAEQYAIQTGVHPAETTQKAIDNFRRQLKRFGFSYDWSRQFGTIDPEYYRWTQWIFLQVYNSWFDPEQNRARPIEELRQGFSSGKFTVGYNPQAAEITPEQRSLPLGSWTELSTSQQHEVLNSWRLCYVAEQTVNWCPDLGTALANEEVIDGRSERGGFPVLRKPLRQWMFRITALAGRLLDGLDGLDWPEATKSKQRTWIGRSIGTEVIFSLQHPVADFDSLRVYTTRPDTLFGATYMVVAPEHPLVDALLDRPASHAQELEVATYVRRARNRSDLDRQRDKTKTGVFSGVQAINPINGRAIPIWIADYVLMGYGHGAIMAVPAHDHRDHEFATTFNLPVEPVIKPEDGTAVTPDNLPYVGPGVLMNSEHGDLNLNDQPVDQAKRTVTAWLQERGLGSPQTNYRLRDWLFSRQRYWGEPFPIVYDDSGHHHGVSPDHLPVVLPPLADYAPEQSDDPKPLLTKASDWLHTTAGQCGVHTLPSDAPVTRESNTMPGWAGSCWYYLRYCDPHNAARIAGQSAQQYWLSDRGVDLYIGGAEHAVLHLLYARFWHQVLHDLGHVPSPEPFQRVYHQGLILSFSYQRDDGSLVPADQVLTEGDPDNPIHKEAATGQVLKQVVSKMSKSLKNVVNPDDVITEYGADTFRLYEMYLGPLDAAKPWNTRDIAGMFRFLQRAWRLLIDEGTGEPKLADHTEDLERKLHRVIKGVTDDLDRLSMNTAIAKLIELTNAGHSNGGLSRPQAECFVTLLSPFVPHVAEELWHRLGHADSVTRQPWPTWQQRWLEDDTVEIPVQIGGKVRARLHASPGASKDALERMARNDDRVIKSLAGRGISKVIVVPGKLVNIVPE